VPFIPAGTPDISPGALDKKSTRRKR